MMKSIAPAVALQPLNIGLWFTQVFLAFMLLVSGTVKILLPADELGAIMRWTNDVSPIIIYLSGTIEIMGSIALVVPAALNIKSELTSTSAIGLTILMLCAGIFHLLRHEPELAGMNFSLTIIAAFIAWGRTRKIRTGPVSKVST